MDDTGIVSLDVLVERFRNAMSELLSEKVAAIVAEIQEVKLACSDLDRRVEAVESENRTLKRTVEDLRKHVLELEKEASSKSSTSQEVDGGGFQEAVRKVVLSEREIERRENNVILSGVPESVTDIPQLLVDAAPELRNEIRSHHRLGRPSDPAAATSGARPRLVKVELSPRGKARLWQERRNVKHADSPIYVNNDLSFQERARRKAVLPTYKALLAAGVRCSLPRDTILKDGTPISEDAIKRATQAQ